jgi:hypothetical protein
MQIRSHARPPPRRINHALMRGHQGGYQLDCFGGRINHALMRGHQGGYQLDCFGGSQVLDGSQKLFAEQAVGLLLFEYVPRDGDGTLLADVLETLSEHEYDVYLAGRRRLLVLTRMARVQVRVRLSITFRTP